MDTPPRTATEISENKKAQHAFSHQPFGTSIILLDYERSTIDVIHFAAFG